jgi:hypothetical protein
MRFFLHMMIASILAPAAGGVVYSFCYVDWHDAMLPTQVFASLLGGFLLLFFVWFLTIPLGLLSYVVCWSLCQANVRSTTIWVFGGAAVGLLFGQYMACWACVPVSLFLVSGPAIGSVTGWALRRIWTPALIEAQAEVLLISQFGSKKG